MLVSSKNYLSHAGQSGEELRELTVEGTTFDPTTGGVSSLTSLDRNLEVSLLPHITATPFNESLYCLVSAAPAPVLHPGNTLFVLLPWYPILTWLVVVIKFAIAVHFVSAHMCADEPYNSTAVERLSAVSAHTHSQCLTVWRSLHGCRTHLQFMHCC